EYNQKLDQKYFDFKITNGQRALESEKNGYSIVGKASDDDSYRGVILVNKDSSINNIADLKNKTIASPGEAALAGHMMPMLYLYKNGLNVKTDFRVLYSSSFESAILNIYLGKCSAGFSWISNWNSFIKRRPEIGSRVALQWKTPALINTAILFRNDMDSATTTELRSLLFSLNKSTEGRKALDPIGFTGFEFADSSTYLPVKTFLLEYNSVLH
ncbi:MAG: phosphate/phosphite/phosphonate ABC transporter substrate-binding protein, partial [Bacteroidota bacterium]